MTRAYLTAAGVAELTGIPLRTCRDAIASGDLPVTSEHRGAGGKATSLGVTKAAALKWAAKGRRKMGRPAK